MRRSRRSGGTLLRSRPAAFTFAVVALALLWTAWIYGSADSKISRDLLTATDRRDVVVELRFPPEKFHMILLQELGRIQAVQDRRIRLLDVPPARIRDFARHYWVVSISSPGTAGANEAAAHR
jgi:hypothetical protein